MHQAGNLARYSRPQAPRVPFEQPHYRPRPGRKLQKAKLLLIVTVCFVLALVMVAQYSTLVVLNYRLGGLRGEVASFRGEVRFLEKEVAGMATISRIEEVARNDLGLVDPSTENLIVLGSTGE